jgi:late competence protein required for DNA uptake (superfamily II DNA/RNA helicase)
MIEFIVFAAVAWFAISMMKDMMRISEKKAIEKAKKEAKDAREVSRAATEAARSEAREKAAAAKAAKLAAAEDMVSCAVCGTQMAKHDAIATQGQFYCSESHFLQRNQSAPAAETIAEPMTEATVENV